jgi:hypothetical protein
MSRRGTLRSSIATVFGLTALLTAGVGMAVTLPPANGKFDYQLAVPYTPAADVAIVDRDRSAAPAAGKYNICYVNAFQTQPGDTAWWKKNHPDLLVKKNGQFLIDPEWPDELLFDTSTAAKRTALMQIVGPWIDRCASDGYKAIEPDNLDSWTRSAGILKRTHNVEFAKLIVARGHAKNLAVAQKNAPELSLQGATTIGFDFAIAEECQVWSECGDYTDVYGAQVYEIEYNDNTEDADGNPVDPISFYNAACKARGKDISVIYRDRGVLPGNAPGYVYKAC